MVMRAVHQRPNIDTQLQHCMRSTTIISPHPIQLSHTQASAIKCVMQTYVQLTLYFRPT